MAERGLYFSISRSLFSGPQFRRLPAHARLTFVVLKGNAGLAGIDVRYPRALSAQVSEESGLTEEQVAGALDTLQQEGWIRREGDVLWIVGHLKFDPHLNPKNANYRKGVQRLVVGLPRLSIVRDFVREHGEWFPDSEADARGYRWALDAPSDTPPNRAPDTPSKPAPKQERKRKRKRERNITPVGATEGASVPPPEPPAPEQPPPEFPSWTAEGVAWWQANVGVIPYPRFGSALTEAVGIHGWPDVFAALKEYVADAKTRSRPAKVEWFVGEVVRWVEWARMPAVLPNGDLTLKGRRASGMVA